MKMSRVFILSSILLIIGTTQTQAAEIITYTVTNAASDTPGGARFKKEIGASYARHTLSSATAFVWKTLHLNDPADRDNTIHKVNLKVETDMSGISDESNNQITLSAEYIENYKGNVKVEITGILYHETAHVWQWTGNGEAPGGLIEGIADYVRLKAGYPASNWGKKGHGDAWDDGFDVTARFLDYCNSLKNGFVAELNKKIRYDYNDSYFNDLLGKSVDKLWSDYKAKYKH
ncbi:unnamed protein product [Amaranthus hypochondriacus]